jgi:hypothetical protein
MSAKRGWGILCGVLLAIGGLVGSRPAHAERVFNERLPFNAALENPCTGELVVIDGEQHMIIKVTEAGNGSLHINVFSSAHGEGVGDQGNSFCISQQDHDVQNLSGTLDHFSSTHVIHCNMISRGSAPNFAWQAVVHFTFTNGEFKAIVDQFQTSCPE